MFYGVVLRHGCFGAVFCLAGGLLGGHVVTKRQKRIAVCFRGTESTNATPPRLRNDRGATLVEYALVLALIVVGSIAAINALDSRGREQVVNQAECVSMRPPPPGCQITPITTSTTETGPPITGSTMPPAEPATPRLSVSGEARVWNSTSPEDYLWAEFDVRLSRRIPDDYGAGEDPVPGVVIRAEARMRNPASPAHWLPEIAYPSCQTDLSGLCTIRFDVPFDDVRSVRIDILSADLPEDVEMDTPIFLEYEWS